MPNTWYTSDTHFTHERVIPYDHRPFRNAAHMDQVLMDNWNDLVQPDDTIWVLGDFSIESGMDVALSYLPRLKGHKHLIMGNHDKCWVGKVNGWKFIPRYLAAGFELVLPWAQTKVNNVGVNLSHFPYTGDHGGRDRYPQFRLPVQEKPILHGHVHGLFKQRGNQINVGVNVWDWAPVSSMQLEPLLRGLTRGQPNP